MQSVKTGARLREILNLRWEWVDLERALLLPDSKTNTKCIIPQCANYGRARCLARVGTYVIPGGSPRPRTDLNRPWRAVSKRAVLDGVRIHDLRHTHANIGAGAGLRLPVLRKLLGHTQAATTARYAHLDADPLRSASEVIGGRIAAAMGEAFKLEFAPPSDSDIPYAIQIIR
jgi:integrase